MAETIGYETKVHPVHHISCDECGKHICDSPECDDGYYDDPSEYEEQICIAHTWYSLRCNLCDECKAKKTTTLIENLKNLGFKEKQL